MPFNQTAIKQLTAVAISNGINVIFAIVILIVGLILAKLCANLIEKLMRLRHIEETVTRFVRRLVYYVLLIFVLIACLSKLGVQTSSLVAIVGAMSLAIGLSLRSSLSNLASGILLIMFRPFKVGDYVEVQSFSGVIEDIQILFTQLKTTANQQITLPNNIFMSHAVMNYSANQDRRADIVIGIGYEDDIDTAKALLRELIQADENILAEPQSLVVVKELADSSVNLLARFYTRREHYWDVVFRFNELVKKRFDAQGISIPYPQSDVHLHQSSEDS